MKYRLTVGRISVLGAGLILLASACTSTKPESQMPGAGFERGAVLFADHCAACHGKYGRGNGTMAGFLPVAPRDFQGSKFRFISASWGEMATEADVARFIREGARGSVMPGHPQLTDEQVRDLTAYVREFRKFGVMDEIEQSFIEDDEDYTLEDLEEIAADRLVSAPTLEVPARDADYQRSTTRGAALFAENCAKCHGPQGHGDGTEELFDETGRSMHARDLTAADYRGGELDRDFFWRIRCGIPGTPMPAHEAAVVSDEEVWQLVDYLRFLAVPK